MLKFRSIEIENFVLFERVVIEPSTDLNRPLTVIRAENGSGKTTLLRAVRWGMYGERGLPGQGQRFPIQPASWRPDDGEIRTEVAIEIETDGATRHNRQGRPTTTVYRLCRFVTTVPSQKTDTHGPDFRRINEETLLMFREADGQWRKHTAGVDVVVRELLPFELQDFFVMDADEAADFVGGSENKVIAHDAVVRKTTKAVHSLLGIDVFRDAANRTSKIAGEFGAQATRAVGDADLNALQQECDSLKNNHEKLEEELAGSHARKGELGAQLADANDDLVVEATHVGVASQLLERLEENRRQRDRRVRQLRENAVSLAGLLESSELLARLTRQKITEAWNILAPLYDSGHIPQAHLLFVRELIRSGVCVCGADLTHDEGARRRISERLVDSEVKEGRANYLAQLYETCQSLHGMAGGRTWNQDRDELGRQLRGLQEEIEDLDNAERKIKEELEQIGDPKIQVLRDQIAALTKQVATLDQRITTREEESTGMKKRIESIRKTLNQRSKTAAAARDHQVAQVFADAVTEMLRAAYETIQVAQVRELSDRMNQFFHSMAANAADEDLTRAQHDKATLRMIAEVGLRGADGKLGSYEIYALNSRGRSMPPVEINGASRRVLALSFVLALCMESGTDAPLIADSMLNFMSGAVRRNTLRVTAENARQPILLLTGSDMEASSEVDAVEQFAGATYTLTPQWEAGKAAREGDVIRETAPGLVSVVCPCGPREFCDACERVGQTEQVGWHPRREGATP